MLDTSKLSKLAKGKIAISGLVFVLILSGCTYKLNKNGIDKSKNKVLIETSDEIDYEIENSRIDSIMDFSKEVDEDKEYLEYTYLIDNSDTTTATLAHVIDEKTITSTDKKFDGKEKVDFKILNEDIIQPIVLPKAFVLFNVENVSDLVDGYGDCDITGRKMITLDGDILYYFESTITFNSFAARTIFLDINEGDTITAKALYKVYPSGQLELLYRTQEGIKSDTDNVIEANYNDAYEVVVPLERSVFSDMNGKYSEEEANEEIKTYKKY